MARLEPCFPKSHGKSRVDDRRILSGMIFINRNGVRVAASSVGYWLHRPGLSHEKKRCARPDVARGRACQRRCKVGQDFPTL